MLGPRPQRAAARRRLFALLLVTTAAIALAIYLFVTNPVPEPTGCNEQPEGVLAECARDSSAPTPAVPGVQP